MNISQEEIIKEKPKKPLNAYFKFRSERLKVHRDKEDCANLVKNDWDQLSQQVKQAMNNAYLVQLEQYKKDIEQWKNKYNIDDKLLKQLHRKMINAPIKEQCGERERPQFHSFKAESINCLEILSQNIKKQLKNLREKIARYPQSETQACRSQYQRLCNFLSETIYYQSQAQ